MFNGQNLADFLTGNLVVPAVIIVAVVVILGALTGSIRKAAISGACVLIAFFLIGLATHSADVGGWLYGLFFPG